MLRLLLALHVALVSASVIQVDTEHGTIRGTLTLEGIHRRGTTASVVGSFTSKGDDTSDDTGRSSGIRFRSTPYSVDITTLDGQVLVKASSFSVAVQTDVDDDEDEEETAIYQILDDVFVEANSHLYRSSEPEGVHPTDHDEFARLQLLSSLENSAALDNPRAELRASIERLVEHPATQLLEPAAFALGNDLGINGEDEPAVLPFYTVSMTLTEAYNRQKRAHVLFWDDFFTKRQAVTQGKYPNCDVSVCPPCKEDECYGLCGYGCTCWKHLCRDCCYHKGCRDHDKCCRRDGFFSPSCTFPFWFRCNKRFKCRLTP